MKFKKKITYVAVLLTLIAGVEISQAKAKAKPRSDFNSTYTIVHAIPTGFGADVVDVYTNGKLIIDNATPGSIKSFTIPRERVEIEIYKDGETPTATSVPLLASPALYLTYGINHAFVAHLTEDEKPKLTVFKDTISEAGIKRSWITIRHIAGYSATQFRINQTPTFIPISNQSQRKRTLLVGNYSIDALVPDSTTVVAAPTTFSLVRGKNLVIYFWGAKSKSNLGFLKQEVTVR